MRPMTKLSKEEVAYVVTEFERGRSVLSMVRELGHSFAVIRRHLTAEQRLFLSHKWDMGQLRQPITHRDVSCMRRRGYTMQGIANHYEVSRHTIYKRWGER